MIAGRIGQAGRSPHGTVIGVAALAIVLLIAGCDKLFDITPYEAEPPDDLRDLTASNLQRIHDHLAGHTGPLVLGLTSDTHYHYGDLEDVVSSMKGDPAIDLVLVTGDLSDQGLVGEFEWFARAMLKLDRPWLAVIGNHDHQANGRTIYESMFGPRNFTMDLGPYRFIFFDDTVWESDMAPDVAWMAATLNELNGRIPIVATHIPPFTDQLLNEYGEQLRTLWAQAGVPLVLVGHRHGFDDQVFYGDGVRYLSIPWPDDRRYLKLTMDSLTFTVDHVFL